MYRWKVAGALVSPKAQTLNLNKPSSVIKEVLSLSSSDIGICQYPAFKSRLEKYLFPFKVASASSIRGKAFESFTVNSLNFR